jgi:MATE family multidrug resistance protein
MGTIAMASHQVALNLAALTFMVPVAAGYALASIPGILPFYVFNVLRQSLQAMGRVAPILITALLANVANVFFNWVLIFGNLGAPALGAVGSGWGTSLSRWLMTFALLAMAWPLLRSAVRPLRRDALAIGPLVRFVRLGAPRSSGSSVRRESSWGGWAPSPWRVTRSP